MSGFASKIPEPLEPGDIIYGNVTDNFGNKAGYHPLVIVSAEKFEHVGLKYYVVIVTSQMHQLRSDRKHHRMVHQGRTDPRTKFDKENFADCDGVYAIWHRDIANYKGGRVYDEDFDAIKKLVGPPPHRRQSRPQQ